jgi:lipoprotein-anchoring transpeptidase ErfK/SrfK
LLLGLAFALIASPSFAAKHKSRSIALTIETINGAAWSKSATSNKLSPLILKAEVLLKRAGFSPGVIDAEKGENFQKAVRAYQEANALEATGELDETTWNKVSSGSREDIVRHYTIAAADLEHPFVKSIPKDFEKMAELEHLGYGSPRELLAEKFQLSEALLAALNRGKALDREGADIVVPNVPPMEVEQRRPAKGKRAAKNRSETASETGKAERIVVNKQERSVRVFDEAGNLVAYYPASIGSAEKPAPSGKFEVRNVAVNPTYRYDPKYAFKGQKAEEPVEIAAGPNNPVGLVWIALSAESYGIHGTPNPDKVSKTESHGCVRLTNWDALALAKAVKKGTPVEFVD